MPDEYASAAASELSGGAPSETMDEGTPPTPPAGEDQGQGNGEGEASLFLTPDMLPSGMKVNAGDVLEFKVVNPTDPDGHIEVVYNTGKAQEKGPDWENDFRSHMSAEAPQIEPE